MSPRTIRQLRRLLRCTQQEMADRLCVSLSAVQGWEAPEGSPRHRKPLRANIAAMQRLQDDMCGRRV